MISNNTRVNSNKSLLQFNNGSSERKAILKKQVEYKNSNNLAQRNRLQRKVLIQSFKGSQANNPNKIDKNTQKPNKSQNHPQNTLKNKLSQNNFQSLKQSKGKQNNQNCLSLIAVDNKNQKRKKSIFLQIQEQEIARRSGKRLTKNTSNPSRVCIQFTESNIEQSQQNYNFFRLNRENNSSGYNNSQYFQQTLNKSKNSHQNQNKEFDPFKSCKNKRAEPSPQIKQSFISQSSIADSKKCDLNEQKKQEENKIQQKKQNQIKQFDTKRLNCSYTINIKNQSQLSKKSQNTQETSKDHQQQMSIINSAHQYDQIVETTFRQNVKQNNLKKYKSAFRKKRSQQSSQSENVSIWLNNSDSQSKFIQTAQFFLQRPPALNHSHQFKTIHTFKKLILNFDEINQSIVRQVCFIRFINRLKYKINKHLRNNMKTFKQVDQVMQIFDNVKLESIINVKQLNFLSDNCKQKYKNTKYFQSSIQIVSVYDREVKHIALSKINEREQHINKLRKLLVSSIECLNNKDVSVLQNLRDNKRTNDTLLLRQKINTLKFVQILLKALKQSQRQAKCLYGNRKFEKLILQIQWSAKVSLNQTYQIWQTLKNAYVQKD